MKNVFLYLYLNIVCKVIICELDLCNWVRDIVTKWHIGIGGVNHNVTWHFWTFLNKIWPLKVLIIIKAMLLCVTYCLNRTLQWKREKKLFYANHQMHCVASFSWNPHFTLIKVNTNEAWPQNKKVASIKKMSM